MRECSQYTGSYGRAATAVVIWKHYGSSFNFFKHVVSYYNFISYYFDYLHI